MSKKNSHAVAYLAKLDCLLQGSFLVFFLKNFNSQDEPGLVEPMWPDSTSLSDPLLTTSEYNFFDISKYYSK